MATASGSNGEGLYVMLYGGIMSGKTCVYIRYLEKKFAYGTYATIGQLSLASS